MSMAGPLAGKTAIVTGASRGIGLAIARRLGRVGCRVVLTARDAAALEPAADELRRAGVACEAVRGDVAVEAEVRCVVARAVEVFGAVDILVNNAGVAPLCAVEQMDDALFQRTLDTNVVGVFRFVRAVWPVMRRSGGGVIVNISSRASQDPYRGFAVYGACKAWVNLFTQALADEGREVGIRVFAVAPGGVETRMLRDLFPDVPAEQILQPDEVAAVVEQVCRPEMACASGQTIFVKKQ